MESSDSCVDCWSLPDTSEKTGADDYRRLQLLGVPYFSTGDLNPALTARCQIGLNDSVRCFI